MKTNFAWHGNRFLYAILLLCLLPTVTANAQTADSVLDLQVHHAALYTANRSARVYLHTDKNIYNTNENILFTAFLTDAGGDTTEQHTLYIVLTSLAGRQVVASDRFVLQNGIASGSLFIPDTLDNGQYLLAAYTNTMREGRPDAFFRQELTIKSRTKPVFSFTVLPVQRNTLDSISLTCKIGTDYGGLAAGGTCNYAVYADGSLRTTAKKTIDAFGQIFIHLSAKDTLARNVVVYATVERNGEKMNFRQLLQLTPATIRVHYYPEGGRIIAGHLTRIGIEIRRADGMGVATSGMLMRGDEILTGFHTDEYGFGYMECTLHQRDTCSIQLTGMPAGAYIADAFPVIQPGTLGFNLVSGVARDSLYLRVQAETPGTKGMLVVYSDKTVLYADAFTIPRYAGKLIVPVQHWPPGLAHVCLYNEAGKAVAESAVFVPAPALQVSVTTDSAVYHSRSQVRLHIKVADANGHPVTGAFSFSAMLASRAGREGSIERYTNFEAWLPPVHEPLPPPEYFSSDSAINAILLTRFNQPLWSQVLADSGQQKNTVAYDDYGFVTHNGKKLRKPVKLVVMGGGFAQLTTDSSGVFMIPHQYLVSPLGVNPMLSVVDKTADDLYNISLRNRYDSVNKKIAAAWFVSRPIFKDTVLQEETADDKDPLFANGRTLKKVVVKSGSGDDAPAPSYGVCRDWVCMNNVLNCPNHPFGDRPIKGHVYRYYGGNGIGGPFGDAGEITYTHCISCRSCIDTTTFIGTVKAIHLTKIFYDVDSMHFNPTEPVVLTTLYWVPLVVTDKKGEADIRFFTGDVKGVFCNEIQGAADAGVFTRKTFFKVE